MATRAAHFERCPYAICAAHLLLANHSRERRSGRYARSERFFRTARTRERKTLSAQGRGAGRYDIAHTLGADADEFVDSCHRREDGARDMARAVRV